MLLAFKQTRQKSFSETSSVHARVTKPRTRGKRPFATTTISPTVEIATDQSFPQTNTFNKELYNRKPSNDSAIGKGSTDRVSARAMLSLARRCVYCT